jgi:adhesin HecA-like repeat protein
MTIKAKPFESGAGASVPDASESTKGKIKIATTSESNTGTDDLTAMTPAKVKARIDAALVGGIDYKGTFNATTGLTNSGGNLNNAEQGDLYVIDTAGTIYGATWAVGDHLLINADMGGSISNSKIDKVDNTDLVTSVNGQTGAVNIYADDSTLNIAGTGLSISGSGATSTLNADSASESAAGIIEIATNAEATSGSATDKALVPSNLSSVGTSQLNNDAGFITSVASASDSAAGIIEIATNAEATAGSATDKALVPSNLSSVGTSQLNNDAGFITSVASASDTTAGIIEIATNAEATAGSATDKALVPSNLSSVGTSQLNNDAGFITSAGVGNQITTVEQKTVDFTAVSNAIYFIASSLTVTLPSSSLSDGDLLGFTTRGTSTPTLTLSGALHTINNLQTSSTTVETNRRGLVWFSYDSATSRWAQLNESTKLSSSTTAGIIEIATNAEATAGSATDKALVPSNLSSVGTSQLNNDAGFITSVASASDSAAGIIEIATNAEATAGSATDKALVPSNLSSVGTSQLNNDAGFITSVASASDSAAGIIEIATNAEATAGSATDKALVPSNLSSVGTSQLNNDAGFITSVASASDTTAGIIEIATNAEATAGSATDKALVPSNVASLSIANTQVTGLGTASTAASTDFLSGTGADTLGGNLDVGTHDIVSSSNADIDLAPDGTGLVSIKGNTTGGVNPGTLKLWCENNSHGISIKSPPHSATASYELVLPTGVGTSGQVLKTDGGDGGTPNSVQLAWVDQSGGSGGSVPAVRSVSQSTDYTITTYTGVEEVFLITSGANISINIPAASTVGAGYKYQIKNLGAHTLTIDPNSSETIDTSATFAISTQYAAITIITDGSNWFII